MHVASTKAKVNSEYQWMFFVILVTEWFNSSECLTFQYLPINPSTYVVYLQFILKSIPLNIWDQLSRFKHEQQIWLTHETCLMKNHILLFSCFRLTCSSMLGLFLWVARSHGGHVADGDLIGEYRIVRHSLELNHSVTKITTFIFVFIFALVETTCIYELWLIPVIFVTG